MATDVVLLGDLIEEWITAEPSRAPSTVHRDRWGRDVIVGHFGEDRDAGSISRQDVLEFRALLEETFTGTTPRVIMRLLVRPLEAAHVEGRIPRCVVAGMLLSTTNSRRFATWGSGVKAGDSGTFQVSVRDPGGRELSAVKQNMTLGESNWPGTVPIGFHFTGDLNLKFEQYGAYSIQVSIEVPEGETATAEAVLYVVKPVE